jgi:4-amino-4-deoxy-L-arabinose transferase-like glycosyltransferase
VENTRLLWTSLAGCALGLVFAVNVYRAATQPLTIDEAYVYQTKIRNYTTPAHIFTGKYSSENHILQTLLAFASVKIFGVSELELRIPSLLGGLLYLIGICRLSMLVFQRLLSATLALGLAVLNPLIVDHLSLARGYGIALGFFTWSLYMTMRYLRGDEKRHILPVAGVCLALSVAANLTFAFPGLGLALMFFSMSRRLGTLIRSYCIPGLLVTIFFLGLPVLSMRRDRFNFGAPTLRTTVMRLVYQSFFHHELAGAILPQSTRDDRWPIGLACRAIAVATVVISLCWLAACAKAFRRKDGDEPAAATCLRLVWGTLLLSLAFLILGHWVSGLPYPYDRTGLYLICLFSLACAAAVDWLLGRRGTTRFAAQTCAALLSAIVVWYGLEFPPGYYLEWPFAADVTRHLQIIRERHTGDQRTIRIGGNFVYTPLVAFYRDLYGWNWLETRPPLPAFVPGYDYYLLSPGDENYLDQLHLRKLIDTGRSTLAIP